MKQLAAFALVLAGCLSVPDSPDHECSTNSDCDTEHGEVCEEGTCYGNPPPGPFAVLLSPPTERRGDTVARELILDELPADGYFGNFDLEEPVTFTGQIVCPNECSAAELAATITVTRPSSFAGGPAFRQVFATDPLTGGFKLVLPRVAPGEPDYTVTITPDRRQAPRSEVSLAELVPPLRTTLALGVNQTGKTVDLGGEKALDTITGTIVDALDNPATHYRVVAFGRWDASSPLTEVSTVDFVDDLDTEFTIKLSEGLVGPIEIVAQPFVDANPEAPPQPTLRMSVNLQAANFIPPKLQQPRLDTPLDVVIDIQGTQTGGQVGDVVGARVTLSGEVDGPTRATFEISSDTGADGAVRVRVPGGALADNYRISVVPKSNSNVGVVFDRPLERGAINTIKLPDRLAIVGTALDVEGNPLKDVQVTATPSLRFQWTLAAAPQAFVGGIPAASTVSNENGEFVLFVDPFIEAGGENEDVWGYYDVSFVPAETTNAPLFTKAEVEIPRDPSLKQLSLGSMPLPDAAHIHGKILDPFGEVVEGAEIKLFRVEDTAAFASFCSVLNNPPATCPVPAFLLGRGVSDGKGIARLTLPRL